MFESIAKFFKNFGKKENTKESSDTAKERLHLVLMQDRANVSADFLELMKQEIIEVIKKYIDVDEKAIDVRLTNKSNEDGTVGAPALYANIPITTIKNEARKVEPQEKTNEVKAEVESKKTTEPLEKEKVEKEEKKKSVSKEVKKDKPEEVIEKKSTKQKAEPQKEKVEKKTKVAEKENSEKKAKHVKEEVEEVKEAVKKK